MAKEPKKPRNFCSLLAPDGVYKEGVHPPPLRHSANPTRTDYPEDLEMPYGQHVVVARDPDGEHYWTVSNCQHWNCGDEFFQKVPNDGSVVGDFCRKHDRYGKAHPVDPPDWLIERLKAVDLPAWSIEQINDDDE